MTISLYLKFNLYIDETYNARLAIEQRDKEIHHFYAQLNF